MAAAWDALNHGGDAARRSYQVIDATGALITLWLMEIPAPTSITALPRAAHADRL